MEKNVDDITEDILFVGLTRPATVAGIPFGAFVIEIMAIGILFIAVLDPLYLLLGVPVHAILYLVSSHDPGIFHSMYVWTQTIGKCLNTRFWGAASFSPVATPTKK